MDRLDARREAAQLREAPLAARDARVAVVARRLGREALRRYDRRCDATFLPSFWLGRAFRGALHTPLLDWIVSATQQPAIQRAAARFLAHF